MPTTPTPKSKRPYRSPKLTELGAVARITRAILNGSDQADNPINMNQKIMS